jgi:hypothetical protein
MFSLRAYRGLLVYWIQGALDDTKRIEVLYLGLRLWRCDFQVCTPLHPHSMSIRAVVQVYV